MTSKTALKRRTRGWVEFVIRAEEETLDVHLDRQGFRRLVQTLEQLAEHSETQTFEKSGRQDKRRNSAASTNLSLTKLTFHIDGKPTR